MNGAGKPSSVKRRGNNHTAPANGVKVANGAMAKTASTHFSDASFMKWTVADAVHVATHHWMPCLFALGLLFFMGVEYTLFMVPPSSPPFDLGFIATRHLHAILESSPDLNTLLAALNTVLRLRFLRSESMGFFIGVCRNANDLYLVDVADRRSPQSHYFNTVHVHMSWDFGVLHPAPVASGSVIASLDMRRMQRKELAWTFDVLNVLQAVRLLGTRGHYTIDLAVGVGAGLLFDSLAGKYEYSKRKGAALTTKHDFS
ncbi:Phosphatidylcholine:diacylglycerol cholinephosphotransferase [Vigna angularis]|uniref:Phosphatidylcholine:diacylglycerol cholinephosphotransferase n=1 Tax=Phaseolus angularis TaxID=3914 RepID=A0A8T0JR90_PHAAN|nr:Phosphatidylcholine:diacylglycerol cholinephosphotransferase [Vigna angularis]